MNFDAIKDAIKESISVAFRYFSEKQTRRKLAVYLITVMSAIILAYKPLINILERMLIPIEFAPYIIIPICCGIGIVVSEMIISLDFYVYKRRSLWANLNFEELNFLDYYISKNAHTRYVRCLNGTYTNSGILDLLVRRQIIYLASKVSEFRDDPELGKSQQFPFNIYPDAFKYLRKNRKKLWKH